LLATVAALALLGDLGHTAKIVERVVVLEVGRAAHGRAQFSAAAGDVPDFEGAKVSGTVSVKGCVVLS
jgi:hypothetical protein